MSIHTPVTLTRDLTMPAVPSRVLAARGRTRGWDSEQGLSLIEVTIMLVILLILAGTLVPVMGESVSSARLIQGRNDLQQIAMAVVGFQHDVGPLVMDGSRLHQLQSAASPLLPVWVITSEGAVPEIADRVPVETVAALLVRPGLAGDAGSLQAWINNPSTDLMDRHLRVNGRRYPELAGAEGWNGPYLSRGSFMDPWGRQYLVNTGFLPGLPPSATSCSRCAVFAISAGPNGLIETPFEQPVSNAQVFGDDLAVRIQ